MAIGKKQRFEVFKRDGFTCQYCGRRPPDVVLELDHIDPRALGGSDDEINLVTSCFDCNRGKRDKRLGDVRPRPDADLKLLEVQQEIAEAERYIAASAERDAIREQLAEHLSVMSANEWPGQMYLETWKVKQLLSQNSPEEIELAIKRVAGLWHGGRWQPNRYGSQEAIRYLHGILRNIRREGRE